MYFVKWSIKKELKVFDLKDKKSKTMTPSVGEFSKFLDKIKEENSFYFEEGGEDPLLGNGPTIVLKDGKLFMIYGTPGGEGVGQTTFQALLNVIDFGMGIQEAIEAPRGRIYADPNFYNPEAEITARMESRIPEEVVKELEAKGHTIKMYDAEFTSSAGGMQGILVHPEYGPWTAAGDPRRGGSVSLDFNKDNDKYDHTYSLPVLSGPHQGRLWVKSLKRLVSIN